MDEVNRLRIAFDLAASRNDPWSDRTPVPCSACMSRDACRVEGWAKKVDGEPFCTLFGPELASADPPLAELESRVSELRQRITASRETLRAALLARHDLEYLAANGLPEPDTLTEIGEQIAHHRQAIVDDEQAIKGANEALKKRTAELRRLECWAQLCATPRDRLGQTEALLLAWARASWWKYGRAMDAERDHWARQKTAEKFRLAAGMLEDVVKDLKQRHRELDGVGEPHLWDLPSPPA